MKNQLLLSISHILLEVEPKVAVELIEKNKDIVQGVEVALKKDLQYFETVKEYAKLCGERKIGFQVHGDIKAHDDNQLEMHLDRINEIQKLYGKRLKVVLHSINNNDIIKDIEDTINVFTYILEYIKIHNINIEISIENLNVMEGKKRINLNDLKKVFEKITELKLTYDIGHAIYDGIENLRIDELYFNRLTNIHLHVPINDEDHYPIYEITPRAEEALSLIKDFELIGYNGNIVLEYATNIIEGETGIQKLENYIDLAKVIL